MKSFCSASDICRTVVCVLQPPVCHAKAASDCYGCVIPAMYGTNEMENSFIAAGTSNHNRLRDNFVAVCAFPQIGEADGGNGKGRHLG